MEIYFWLLMLIPFGIAIVASEFESVVAGAISLLVGGLFVYLFSTINPLTWLMENPGTAASYVALYFVLGAIYSVFKWFLIVNRSTDRIKRDYEVFKSNRRTGEDTSIEAFKKSDYNSLVVSRNKARIMGWMVWWVPSLFWTITHDLFKSIWDHIYNMFSSLYEKIVTRKIENTLKDF